jgi:hypothetical protein
MLASEAVALGCVPLGVVCGGEVEECGDEDDMALCRAAGAQVHGCSEWLGAIRLRVYSGSTQRALRRAIGGYVGIHERSVDVQVGRRPRANQLAAAGQGRVYDPAP